MAVRRTGSKPRHARWPNFSPLTGGRTVVAEKTDVQIKQEPGNLIQIAGAPALSDVVRALNALGATPQDLLAILQAIKAAGAIQADIEVM